MDEVENKMVVDDYWNDNYYSKDDDQAYLDYIDHEIDEARGK